MRGIAGEGDRVLEGMPFESPGAGRIEIEPHRAIGPERNLQDPAGDGLSSQQVEGVVEQPGLHVKAHQPVRDRDADEARMLGLTLHQQREIGPVVRHQYVSVGNRAPNQSPVLPRPQAEPGDVRRQRIPPLSRDDCQAGAQAFVDQELHRDPDGVSKATSPEEAGTRARQAGATRGRPRRG